MIGIGTPSSHRSIERMMFSLLAIDDHAATRSRGMRGLSLIHAMARYRRNDDLLVGQGAAMDSVVITEFPSIEAARAWYDSAAYREVRRLRHLSADYRAFLVEGV